VLYLEHKWLYRRIRSSCPRARDPDADWRGLAWRAKGRASFIISYGATLWKCSKRRSGLDKEDGVLGRVLDYAHAICRWTIAAIVANGEKTNKC